MAASLTLSWHERVSLAANDGEIVVEGPRSRLTLRRMNASLIEAMRQLAPPGADADLLREAVATSGGAESLARWLYCLDELDRRSLVQKTLVSGRDRLATVIPVGRPLDRHDRKSPSIDATTSLRLSRFAYLRREGEQMVLESPLAHSRAVLNDPRAVAVVASLAAPSSLARLEASRLLPTDAARRLVELLFEARMVDAANDQGDAARETAACETAAYEVWEFHDLLFHSRSRRGRSDAPFGGTFRFADRPPPAALKSVAGPSIALERPDLERIQRDDPPLACVQERRRSIREYGPRPITVRQLGEFLFRVARVREQRQVEVATAAGEIVLELATRPYPTGGALYELEFYVAVRNCDWLESGFYYYEPLGHRLIPVNGDRRSQESLVDEAAASAGIDSAAVHVLIILATRFQRLAWKYESIAYALTLKHVGVVYQTMYLVATAMGLAPCALGCGDADVFARASNNDYGVETSVGEFLLGSRAS